MREGTSFILISILVLVIIGGFLFYKSNNIEPSSVPSSSYWNQVALTNNLIDKMGIQRINEGNGNLVYDVNGTEYGIQCENYIKGNEYFECCKEGIVEFGEKYNWDSVYFVSVTKEDDCFKEIPN